MAENECNVEWCKEPLNPHNAGSEYCIFHDPDVSKKGKPAEFTEKLKKYYAENQGSDVTVNFMQFVFPSGTKFENISNYINSEGIHAFSSVLDFSKAKFNDAFFDNIVFEKNVNFNNAIFLGEKTDFKRTSFKDGVCFNCAEYHSREVNFKETEFEEPAVFSKCKFFKKAKEIAEVKFYSCIFLSEVTFVNSFFYRLVRFDKTEFKGAKTGFWNTHFFEHVKFKDVVFESELTSFKNASFFAKEADFKKICVKGNIEFRGVRFFGNVVRFNKGEYHGDITFHDTQIYSEIDFINISLLENAIFYFQNPVFFNKDNFNSYLNANYIYLKNDLNNIYLNKKKEFSYLIKFINIHFKPYKAIFEGIKAIYKPDEEKFFENPIFIFRYCQLNNVFFTNCDMFLFSFYNSAFDEVRITDWNWGKIYTTNFLLSILSYTVFRDKIAKCIKVKLQKKHNNLDLLMNRRNYIIFEEIAYHANNEDINYSRPRNLGKYYLIERLFEMPFEIASIYRRFKTAFDYTKDYPTASRFYYNEFEMRRLTYKKDMNDPEKGTYKDRGRNWLYGIYKLFAGYGDRPWRSLGWFFLFSLISAFGYRYSSLSVSPGPYDYYYEALGDNLISDLKYGVLYTWYKLIPFKLMSMFESDVFIHPKEPFWVAWRIIFTIILYLLLIFFALGLKRHFRRF